MKYQAETHYLKGLRFPIPQDKGNVGSEDEIDHYYSQKAPTTLVLLLILLLDK